MSVADRPTVASIIALGTATRRGYVKATCRLSRFTMKQARFTDWPLTRVVHVMMACSSLVTARIGCALTGATAGHTQGQQYVATSR